MEVIEHNGVKINVTYSKCCDTCVNKSIQNGYSGRRSNGVCKLHKFVINRITTCEDYTVAAGNIRKHISGSKAQAKWHKGEINV